MRRAACLLALAAACAAPPPPPRPVVARVPVYPADLGIERLNVAHYPPAARRGYAAFARACSSCHGLSRALDAPLAGRPHWEAYLSARRRDAGHLLDEAERRAILDFLDYDEKARKSGPVFDARVAELERRLDALLAARRRSEPFSDE